MREVAYVARNSNGSLSWAEVENMEPARIRRRRDAINWLLSKEYPDP
jgi:hypothetical protein